jgi:hypothetical protein
MASQGRTSTREEESRLQVRTLVIASLASLAAALITSRLWTAGTPIAAAVTPVIVTIVSELLHRPTAAIARRVTSERTAILPEAMGAGPPEDEDREPTRVARDLEGESPPMRVYRPQPRRWGRIHPRIVVLTGLLAFAIAAAALTLPELIAGQSIGKSDRKTSLFGGRHRDDSESQQPEPQRTAPEEQPEETTPSETQPEEQPAPQAEPPATTEEPTPTVPTVPETPLPDQP